MVPADLIAARRLGRDHGARRGGVGGHEPAGHHRRVARPPPSGAGGREAALSGPARPSAARADRSTRSGSSTWSITMCAAPMTPAMWPSSVSAISRWREATGVACAVDDLAHGGEHLLVGLGELAADHHRRRVQQVHGVGHRGADEPAAAAHLAGRLGVPLAREAHDVRRRRRDVAHAASDRPAAGHGVEAADVAAAADLVRIGLDDDVPDVAGGAALAAQDPARIAISPAPMPLPIFTKIMCWSLRRAARCSPSAMIRASLSTSTGQSVVSVNMLGTSTPSQPGIAGGLTGRPVSKSTGPGSPMPTPSTSLQSRPVLREQLGEPGLDPVEHDLGALVDLQRCRELDQRLRAEVAHGEVAAGLPEVADHDQARRSRRRRRSRPDGRRWTARRRRRVRDGRR